jgi:hypothetical protein
MTALSLLLTPERIHLKAASSVGFKIPTLCEVHVGQGAAPILVSNSRGKFVKVPHASKEGYARVAFADCTLEQEGGILRSLVTALGTTSQLCSTVAGAMAKMRGFGVEPKTLIVSVSFLQSDSGPVTFEEVEAVMLAQGFVSRVDGVNVLVGDLDSGVAVLAATPSIVGEYIRTDDRLGILLKNVDKTLVLVV